MSLWRFRPNRIRGWTGLWLAVGGSVGMARAAAPVLDQIHPVAVRPGTTNTVQVVGQFDPWPPKLWTDAPGVVLEASTNKGSLQVVVAATAIPGPYFVRLYNSEGASAPRFLVVTDALLVAEAEPNDGAAQAQRLEQRPVQVNGRLEKSGDVDSYAVKLEAGETLVAAIEAHTLMSPVDAVLRLLDARGVQVAWNHDDGRTFDPQLVWKAAVAGTYVVQVFGFDYPAGSDIKFSGNAKCVYRLHLGSGPFLHHPMPLGIQRGVRNPLQLHQTAGGKSTQSFDWDATKVSTAEREVMLRPPGFANAFPLAVGEGPERVEPETATTATAPVSITVPGAVSGKLDPAGDVDRYAFVSRAGELWSIAVQSASLGFPVDAWLRIEDATGKELAKGEDSRTADPLIHWTAPAGTNFVAVIGGLGRQGGPECLYRLSFDHPEPSLQATVTENVFSVEAGKTNEIKVNVVRQHGFTNQLKLEAGGLPEGVVAQAGEITDKGGEVVFKLMAATNAAAFSGLLQLQVADSMASRRYPVRMDLVSAGENNGVPQGFRRLVRESIDAFWLTVRPTTNAVVEKK